MISIPSFEEVFIFSTGPLSVSIEVGIPISSKVWIIKKYIANAFSAYTNKTQKFRIYINAHMQVQYQGRRAQ